MQIANSKINNLLIALPDLIGLNVLSLPALRQIAERFQGKSIHLLGFNNCSELLFNEQLPELVLIDRSRINDELQEYVKNCVPFDLVFDFLSSRETGQVFFDSKIPYRLGWDYSDTSYYNIPVSYPSQNQNTVYDYLDFLGTIKEQYRFEVPRLTVSAESKQEGHKWLLQHRIRCEKLIVLGLGGGNNRKQWPLSNYLRLRAELKRMDGLETLFVVGPKELHLLDDIAEADRSAVIACNLSLPLLKGILANADCVVANDYAVMHISAALGIPTIAVFLSSDPRQWFPYQEPSRYVMGKDLACRPCYREDCDDWQCNDLSLYDRVWELVKYQTVRSFVAGGNHVIQ